jgi:hypothetical protein
MRIFLNMEERPNSAATAAPFYWTAATDALDLDDEPKYL